MKSARRRTNYSPVRQMSHHSHDLESPVELHTTSERDLVYNQQIQTGQASRIKQIDQEHNKEQVDPEEVYLCDCCGVTKELAPSIKYMSAFKSIFFIFNFLVFLFGLANFGMGLWFRIDPKIYEIHKYIETQNFTIAGWIMLFCGFATCLMALFGFAATARQSVGSLLCYMMSMIILTVAFVGTLVLLTVYGLGVPLERFITKEIYEQIRRRSMNTETDLFRNSDAVQFLDFIQVKMLCCGAVDFRDYSKLGMVVPTTCYTVDKNYVNARGCGRAIRELFDIRAGLGTGFCSASIVNQLIAIILAALMFCSIYHSRAKPEQVASELRTSSATARVGTPVNLYQQGPRSRTPIII